MFFPVAGMDTHFHDSYFVVAHFHYVFIGGTVFGLFAGLWYPKATGRKLNETLGLWHFMIGFASYNAAFWPMHALGIMGMPRRTHTYTIESGFAEYNAASIDICFHLSVLNCFWYCRYHLQCKRRKRAKTHGADGLLNGLPHLHRQHLRLTAHLRKKMPMKVMSMVIMRPKKKLKKRLWKLKRKINQEVASYERFTPSCREQNLDSKCGNRRCLTHHGHSFLFRFQCRCWICILLLLGGCDNCLR